MRRASSSNGFEVVVKAPTLGLYTRIPGEQPDPRAATAASNVRFAEGVAMNAPGYGVLVTNPVLPKLPVLFQQIVFERGGKFSTSVIVGTADKLYSLFRYPEDVVPEGRFSVESLLEFPRFVAEDPAGGAFVTTGADSAGSKIIHVSPAGVQTVVVASGLGELNGIAVLDSGSLLVCSRTLRKVFHVAPNGSSVAVSGFSNDDYVSIIRAYDGKFYARGGSSIVRIEPDGLSGSMLYETGGGVGICDLPGNGLIATRADDGAVTKIEMSGTARNLSLSTPGVRGAVGTGAYQAYICGGSSGRLYRAAVGTGEGVYVAATGLQNPSWIARVADGRMYMTSNVSSGGVYRVTPSGAVSLVITGIAFPRGITALSDGDVLVCGYGDGRLIRVRLTV